MKNYCASVSITDLISFFCVVFCCFIQSTHGQANSIRTGVTFNWADTQTNLSDPANLQSIDINGVGYTTFVVPSSYEMTRLGSGGDGQNNVWENGSRIISGSNDPNWAAGALAAYQSLNLNHYFESLNNGDNFCEDYTAIATTDAQIQTIRYSPGIPSNPDGVLAVTERGGNNCMYIEFYGIPVGGGAEQLLGRTFVRNQGNLTGINPQAAPTPNSDYWSSGRNHENNQVIAIALYELSELAPVGSTITAIRYMGATNDHGDGKFFLMQTYAEDDSLRIKLDREGNGDIGANDMVPPGSTYTLTSGTANGTLTFNPDGTFNYVPNPGFTGNDTFEYEVCLPAPNTHVCDAGTAIIVIKLEAVFDNLNVTQDSSDNAIAVLDNDNFGSSGPKLDGAITNFTLPVNGTIALNNNGTSGDSYDDFFTYTPNTGFNGTDFFTYEITDAGGNTDTAFVYVSSVFDMDTDGIDDKTDLDDDNDGIIDANEAQECINDAYFAWEFNAPVGTRTNDFVENTAITNWLITGTDVITTGVGLNGNSPDSELQLTNIDATTYQEAIAQNEYVQLGFSTATGLINPLIESLQVKWNENSGGTFIGNSYDMAIAISKDNFTTSIVLYSDIQVHYPTNGISETFDLLPFGTTFNLEENTAYEIRVYVYNQLNNGNVSYSVFDDFTVNISACLEQNNDGDGIPDHLDEDSDNDGCFDVTEAGHLDDDDDGYLGSAPLTVDASGVVTGQGGYTGNNSNVTTGHQLITFTTSPIDQRIGIGDSASFSATVTGSGTTYQWEVSTDEGLTWSSVVDDTFYSGATTNMLSFVNVPVTANTNDYRLVVTDPNNPCIPNYFSDSADLSVQLNDLDSDNDGILDSVEDMNVDGDNDPTTNSTDTDNDTFPDYLDIDSDNDGIPDNVEAQLTSTYLAPSTIDANNNGLDDAYEANGTLGLTPVNTDGADLPDYRDEDSDNDNVPDNVEAHDHDHNGAPEVIIIGSDKDDDGLDDGFEGMEVIDADVNDEINDPMSYLPNTDGDNESDYRDLDDDNDGIPTAEEDGNGDGIYHNDDVDNDGMPDYLEGNLPEVVVYNVVTPNGDGVHDSLTITGLESRPNNTINIYNRWGVLIYSTSSYNSANNTFDGSSQGRSTVKEEGNLPVGTYYYRLNYEDLDGASKQLSGYLYLN